MKLFSAIFLSLTLLLAGNVNAKEKYFGSIDSFINDMVALHDFNRTQLTHLFSQVKIKDRILKAISKPAEDLPWHQYQKIFLTKSRINGGVKFWNDNQLTLQSVAQQYGVPEQIIVAIIGIETRYGKVMGNDRIIDALSTLSFAYPKRSTFFRKELKNFLLLCRAEKIDPLQLKGSYAGAMGVPQFMPSSFLSFSVDHDGDGKRNIWSINGDVFASIANYFIKHQWQSGQKIAYPIKFQGEGYKQALRKGLKLDSTIADLQNPALRLQLPKQLTKDTKVKLLAFAGETGTELWLGLVNFYAITRYNHSYLYAMAVLQLSDAIVAKKYQ